MLKELNLLLFFRMFLVSCTSLNTKTTGSNVSRYHNNYHECCTCEIETFETPNDERRDERFKNSADLWYASSTSAKCRLKTDTN